MIRGVVTVFGVVLLIGIVAGAVLGFGFVLRWADRLLLRRWRPRRRDEKAEDESEEGDTAEHPPEPPLRRMRWK